MKVRTATVLDAPAITAIYNEGIASRRATFETDLRTLHDTAERIENVWPQHTWLVATDASGSVIGWAATMPYSSRAAYAGVAEFSIYVAGSAQGSGVGRVLLGALLKAAEQDGLYKVTSRVFTENVASRALCASLGFREVGVHLRHGRLDGVWRDVVTVEALLGEAR